MVITFHRLPDFLHSLLELQKANALQVPVVYYREPGKTDPHGARFVVLLHGGTRQQLVMRKEESQNQGAFLNQLQSALDQIYQTGIQPIYVHAFTL